MIYNCFVIVAKVHRNPYGAVVRYTVLDTGRSLTERCVQAFVAYEADLMMLYLGIIPMMQTTVKW